VAGFSFVSFAVAGDGFDGVISHPDFANTCRSLPEQFNDVGGWCEQRGLFGALDAQVKRAIDELELVAQFGDLFSGGARDRSCRGEACFASHDPLLRVALLTGHTLKRCSCRRPTVAAVT
jgi:hypothetical protein